MPPNPLRGKVLWDGQEKKFDETAWNDPNRPKETENRPLGNLNFLFSPPVITAKYVPVSRSFAVTSQMLRLRARPIRFKY